MISKKKKKIQWQQYIGVLFFMMIGAICGFLMITYIESTIGDGADLSENLFTLVSLFVFMYVGFFLHIIIHEGGHLIFGKLSGYTLSSFRIGSFMWLKENDTICFRRFSLSGTGGQCLMAPPEMRDGKIPVILYNLGGSLMNVITGSIFFALHVVFSEFAYLSIVFLMFSIIGFASALMNGVPMRMGTVDNDGYNAWALNRNPDAMRAFWVQMKANERISKGVRLKDMPDEWFEMPTDDAMKNSLVATIGVFACNRLMDAHRFEEADALMTRLLCMDSGMVGLYRNLLICDQIFCELIAQKRDQRIRTKMSKDQKKFMKSMKTFPSVIRTEYAYALLWEKDLEKAEKIKERFEKCAKTYPYPSDIQSERELIEIADNIEQ
ncbi:MAG: M50 family metallopeptidase [Lachnospiraceae bacterium]|nr:M50 family metallopeptidase [Lachnospiraceae bacterium]